MSPRYGAGKHEVTTRVSLLDDLIFFWLPLLISGLIVLDRLLRRRAFTYLHFYLVLAFFYTFTVPFFRSLSGDGLDQIDTSTSTERT